MLTWVAVMMPKPWCGAVSRAVGPAVWRPCGGRYGSVRQRLVHRDPQGAGLEEISNASCSCRMLTWVAVMTPQPGCRAVSRAVGPAVWRPCGGRYGSVWQRLVHRDPQGAGLEEIFQRQLQLSHVDLGGRDDAEALVRCCLTSRRTSRMATVRRALRIRSATPGTSRPTGGGFRRNIQRQLQLSHVDLGGRDDAAARVPCGLPSRRSSRMATVRRALRIRLATPGTSRPTRGGFRRNI